MKRLALFILFLAACTNSGPSEQYGFITTLGRDTISVENVTHQGHEVTLQAVDRFPRLRERKGAVSLNDDGSIRKIVMDIHTPSEPDSMRDQHVEATVANNVVRLWKRDKRGTLRREFPTGGMIAMAHVPQLYSLYELDFAAALEKARNPNDTVRFRQFYLDREFDNFPLHRGFVRFVAPGKAEIRHDWLSGVGEATIDSAGRLLSYSGSRTTYDVRVQRIDTHSDLESLGKRFLSAEVQAGGVKSLSVRDTLRTKIGAADFTVDYGRPLTRGRTILGNVVRRNAVWRTGANAATQFTTSAPITIGTLRVPAGSYTLWTVPRSDGADLIVNKQTGQWGTDYNSALNLGRTSLRTETTETPLEKFTISITPVDPQRGVLVIAWDSFRWTAPITIR
jgi:hypothetical protein